MSLTCLIYSDVSVRSKCSEESQHSVKGARSVHFSLQAILSSYITRRKLCRYRFFRISFDSVGHGSQNLFFHVLQLEWGKWQRRTAHANSQVAVSTLAYATWQVLQLHKLSCGRNDFSCGSCIQKIYSYTPTLI